MTQAAIVAVAHSEGPFSALPPLASASRLVARRAERVWTAAGLTPIGFHPLRHTCASIFIAAGVNAKALSTFLGHASISITLDRYGHLFPGSGDEAVALVDAYLERTTGAKKWRIRAATRAVEPNLAGLENRYPSLGGSRVRIPPPPLG